MSILNSHVVQFPEVDAEMWSPIFFLTITTGDAQGLDEGLTMPCSSIPSVALVPAYERPDSDGGKAA